MALTRIKTDQITNGEIKSADLDPNIALPSGTGFTDNSISGDKIDGGTISNFASTGIDDNATTTALTINSDGSITGAGALSVSGSIDSSQTILTSRFLSSPYQPVAPRGRVYQGTGALSDITTAIATGAAPKGIAVDPSGRFVYVANNTGSTISQYSINQSTGALTNIGTSTPLGASPQDIAVDPTGRFVYTPNFSSSNVSQYSINQTTGVLTNIGTIASASNPGGVAVDPTGRFVYATGGGFSAGVVNQYSINQSTGALTSITTAIAAGQVPGGVTVDPTGRFVYVANYFGNNISQYSINQSTGALTSVGTPINTFAGRPRKIAVDPSGRFAYVANEDGSSVSQYSINQTTGALTSIGSAIAAGTSPQDVEVDPTGRFVYVTNYGANTVSRYSINQTTGALTSLGTVATGTNPQHVAADPTGRFAYVTNEGGTSVSQYVVNNFSAGQSVISGALDVGGALNVSGAVNIGGHLVPSANVAYDLGSASFRFRDLYLSGTTINLGTASISAVGTGISLGGNAVITAGDTGTIHNVMLAGSITNNKLLNSSITVGTTSISLGASSTTLAGLTSVTSTGFTGTLTGNASTATTLATSRTIALTGDVTYVSESFNGSANVTGTATLAAAGTAGTYTKVTTDAKGRVTSGTTLLASDVTTALGFTPYNSTNPNGFTSNTGTVTGVSGTAPIVSSGGTAPAISISAATTEAAGSMSAADKSKLDGIATGATNTGSVTNTNQLVNGSGYITSAALSSYLPLAGGTLSGDLLLENNYLRFNQNGVRSWNIRATGGNLDILSGDELGSLRYNGVALTGNTGTVTGVSGTAPIVSSGGTAPAISISAATVSAAGSMSAADKSKLDGIATGATNTGSVTNTNQLVNGSGFITSESDTLATVTGRGATTATAISLTNSTASTSTATGALTVAGGVGIAGALNVGDVIIGINGTNNAYGAAASGKLYFGSAGSDAASNYYIGTAMENSYSRLDFRWYTGQRFYSHAAYSGFRFIEIGTGNTLFSVGEGDLNVRVSNTLTANGDLRAPIFYDSNDTTYYTDPASTSNIYNLTIKGAIGNGTAPFRIAPVSSSGTFQWASTAISSGLGSGQTMVHFLGNALSQGNSGYLGFQYNGAASGSNFVSLGFYANDNILRVYNNTYTESLGSMRSPIFYDSNDTGYYTDPASTSVLNTLNVNNLNVGDGNVELYRSQTVDMSNTSVYNTSTYYPVIISVDTSGASIEIQNNLNSNQPSWSTHSSGFTINLRWRTNGSGWGTTEVKRRVEQYHERFANQQICGGISQLVHSSEEVVWLRGGGVYYFKFSRNLTARPQSGSYTVAGLTAGPLSTPLNTIWDSATGSHVSYNTNVFADSRIDSPIFYDSNNTGYYVDPASTSNLIGLTVANTITGSITGSAGSISGFNNPTTAATANTIAYRDGAGDITVRELVLTVGVQDFTPSSLVAIYPTTNQAVKVTAGGARNFLDVPTRAGSNASGTWGINITGSANSLNLDGHTITNNSWAGAGGYHGYQYNGGNWRFGFSSTSGGVDVYADGNFYATDSSHLVLHAGNYTSYAPGFGSTNTFTGQNYFSSNLGSTSGSLSGPPLQAHSSGNNSAFMSFHKGGHYAVNMGLDSDNVLRIGGWSAPAGIWQLDMSGNNTVSGSSRAPIFYDSNDTAYYTDPNSGSRLLHIFAGNVASSNDGGWNARMNLVGSSHARLDVVSNSDGIITTMYSHTGQGVGKVGMMSNHPLVLMAQGGTEGGSVFAGSLRSAIFYDSNDTSYYVDPNSTSNSALRMRGGALFGSNPTWGAYLYVGTNGNIDINTAHVAVTNGNLHLDAANGYVIYLNNYSTSSYTIANQSMRSPLFYDSNDTAYYTDPSSTSSLIGLTNDTFARLGLNLHRTNRRDYTADANYFVGSQGWHETHTWDNVLNTFGSTFIDLWGSNRQHPQGNGYTHAQGIQSLHYRDGGSVSYGWQMVGATSADSRWWLRGKWGNEYRPFYEIALYGRNVGGNLYANQFYDSNNTAFYLDPDALSQISSLRITEGPVYYSTSGTGQFIHDSDSTPVAFSMTKGGNSAADGSTFGVLNLKRTNHSNGATTAGASLFFELKTDTGAVAEYAGITGRKTVAGSSGGQLDFHNYGRNVVGYTNASELTHTSSVRAPIFYDSNDTSYYVDPHSTSSLQTTVHRVIRFHGEGGDSGNGNVPTAYGIYQQGGSWLYPYPDLCIGFHTGIKIGAHYNYNGTRFYNNSDWVTEIFSVGNGDNNVRVTSDIRSPIYYDLNDTSYYLDPNSNSRLVNLGLGNVTPDVRLSVSGDAHISSYLYMGGTAGSVGSWSSRLLSSGGATTLNTSTFTVDRTGYGGGASMTFNTSGVTITGTGQSFAAITDLGFQSPIQISATQTGTSAERYIPMISGTSVSPSGYQQHTVFGSLRGTVWGSAFIAVGGNDSYPTTAYTFHYGGYASAPDSWRAPIFYDSNDTSYYVDPHSTSYQRSLFLGAHDSGASEFRFGEDSAGWYGDRWYWDSGFNVYRYSRHAGTDSLIHYHDTRDTSRITYGRNIVFDDYGKGIVGNYDSYRLQAVFAMGDSYKLATNGQSAGNLYGLAWSHPNAGSLGGANNLSSHGLLLLENGTFQAALSSRAVFTNDVRGTLFYDYNNTGYYVDPNNTSNIYALQTGQVVIGGTFANNPYNAVASTRLMFGGGDSNAQGSYYIGTNISNYGGDYSKLDIRWHTGIRIGAQSSYGGVRFYDTESFVTQIFAVGQDGPFVRANQSLRTPIIYDLDNAAFYLDPSSTGTSLNVAGAIVAAGNITAFSDIRVKKDIKPILDPIEKVKLLNGVTFSRTDLEDKDTRYAGLIAQDVEAALPEAVFEDTLKRVDYNAVIGLLVEAVKKQQEEIDQLKALINRVS